MNPLNYIEDIRNALIKECQSSDLSDTITKQEYYDKIIGILDVLNQSMEDAKFNYEVLTVEKKPIVYEDYTLLKSQLNEDVVIFQPFGFTQDDIDSVDLQSLADILKQLKDNDEIKENIMILPPNVNVFRARLAKDSEE